MNFLLFSHFAEFLDREKATEILMPWGRGIKLPKASRFQKTIQNFGLLVFDRQGATQKPGSIIRSKQQQQQQQQQHIHSSSSSSIEAQKSSTPNFFAPTAKTYH
jgi:hypothetical protein